ncbi:hypothetical protein GIB67_040960 [Kingdonia uniflora]|uniref:DUF632 domain-containing protein n=1 Tax=Kingdonia uniflora TaxID=39325 RepID=A0A7J7L7C1_9MAGN|nr:hypothetical protein GIB67_040960 [Kingdonia uniflora]
MDFKFCGWVAAQKEYIKNGWLLMCLLIEPEEIVDGDVPFSLGWIGAPPAFVICNYWAQSMEDMISEEENVQALSGFMRAMVDTKALKRDELKIQKECYFLLEEDHKARDLIAVLQKAIREGYPILIIAKDIEEEALATLVVNKLRGALKIAALNVPGFGERKSQYLDGIAIHTGDQNLSMTRGFGPCYEVVLTKEVTIIVGNRSTQDAIIRFLRSETLLRLQSRTMRKKNLMIECQALWLEHKLKEKKLRVEDDLNATKAAVEEGL